MPDRAHKIAARQAELARKKHRRYEHAVQTQEDTLRESDSTTATQQSEQQPIASSGGPGAVPGSKPSLLSSMRKVSSQTGAYPSAKGPRGQSYTQADYFISDLRRILLLISFIMAILIALNFIIK